MTRIHFQRVAAQDYPADPALAEIECEFCRIRPYGGASIIMADPPWHHQDWSHRGNKRKTAGHHYTTRSLDWIKQLPVHVLAARDCLLLMWTTAPLLRQAMSVIEAWGFEYSTSAVWVKRTSATGKIAMGTGRRLRSAHEPILIATRGRPAVKKAIRSAIVTGAEDDDPWASIGVTIEAVRREHSRKPDEAFEAARMMVDGPAVELFSRELRPGWIVWGDQVGRFQGAQAWT